MRGRLDVELLGEVDYLLALERQFGLLKRRQAGAIEDRLLLLQHPPVYTMGRRESSQDILCQHLPAPLHRITRGGEVTYHGPGQLMGYYIARLASLSFGLRQLVYRLEQVFVELLNERWGLSATRDHHHRGVWLEGEKIVALGLAVHGGVTMHGFAFNVCPDLSYYQGIIPCGIADRGVTSLERALGGRDRLPPWQTLQLWVADRLSVVLEYDGWSPVEGGADE